jgi:uncharacterized protein
MATALRRCPQCGAEIEARENPSRPFCSERCKLLDLGNWLGERYRIPGAPADDESPSGEGSPED